MALSVADIDPAYLTAISRQEPFDRASTRKSRHWSKSPSGTIRRSEVTSTSIGPVITVQGDDDASGERHELIDQSSKTSHLYSWPLITQDGDTASMRAHGGPNETSPNEAGPNEAGAQDGDHFLRRRSSPPVRLAIGIRARRFSESNTQIPLRNLTMFDVAALIFNKMVGTGIFTTPGAVLLLTGSKELSLGLWAIGGVYTSIWLLLYLEYGEAFPFTGGELIYLNEVFYRPQLLFTILASSYFLVLWTSSPNAFAFSKHTLLAALPHTRSSADFDARIVKFIAFVIVTTVCLLHYFSSRLGLFLNKLLALFKALLLLSIFIAGMVAARKPHSGIQDWSDKHGVKGGNSLAAFVLILYSYTGWENANYVLGEIEAPKKLLRRGAFLAVITVTILYIMVAAAYYAACDYDSITSTDTDLGMAVIFGPVAFGDSLSLKVSIALSAVGNLVAVVYTSSKVKQQIARQGIIPLHEPLSRDMNVPKGGLFLQWIMSTIYIIWTPTTGDGYNFIIGLQTYSHAILSTAVALGILMLKRVMRMKEGEQNFKLAYLENRTIRYLVLLALLGMNGIVLVVGARTRKGQKIHRWLWPIISGAVYVGAGIYWSWFWILQRQISPKKSADGDGEVGKHRTIGSLIGCEVAVYDANSKDVPQEMEPGLAQSRFDGTRRRTQYKFSGSFAAFRQGMRILKNTLGSWFF